MASVLKVKIEDQLFEVDKLTLGETWLLQREYGVEDVENPSNAFGAYVGLLAIALKRGEPDLSERQARTRVEALTDEQIEVVEETEEAEVVDPPRAGTGNEAGGKKRKAGSRGKTPAAAGPPS